MLHMQGPTEHHGDGSVYVAEWAEPIPEYDFEYAIAVDGSNGQQFAHHFSVDARRITVIVVGAWSLLGTWNRQHPDCEVEAGDHIIAVNGVSENAAQMMEQVGQGQLLIIRAGCPSVRPRMLGDLRPPYGFNPPGRNNTVFVVLRSKTDGNIIKSVQGFQNHQVWSSSPRVNQHLVDAWSHHQHVFLIITFRCDAWGLARMSSPPDRDTYGGNDFWGDGFDYLGDNFKVQWLAECIEPLPDSLAQVADGHQVEDVRTGFDFANHMLRCPGIQHRQSAPILTHPGQVLYQQSFTIRYNPRQNLHARHQAPVS